MIKKQLNFFNSKKVRLTLGVLLLAALTFFSYFSISIYQNVKKLEAASSIETSFYPPYPPLKSTGKDPALLKRGEYLAKAGDCIACHTNTLEKGPSFAGGLPMVTPFGTIYSPNLTPDKETGIGNWTTDQFIKAMREGISPHGDYYYPAFPFYYFNRVSTDDLIALKTYLDSIPPVHQPNRTNEMVFPFNWRFLQLGWRLLFFHPTSNGYQIHKNKSEEWNRGAYLVDGLGHCAMCHSPSYHLLLESLPLGAPIEKYNLAGAKVQGYLAPNITRLNLSSVSTQEIANVFTEDRLIGGGHVVGPMLEVNHDSLNYLTQEDLIAISNYLKTVESQSPPQASGGSGGVGKAIYSNYCEGCHATGAAGAPKYGDAASWSARLAQGKAAIYQNAIKGIGGMPAKGTCLSCKDEDIDQAVDYMLASISQGGTNSPSLTKTEKPKPLTVTDGKRIYQDNCGICHEAKFQNAPKPGDKAAWKPMINAGFLSTYMAVVTGKSGHPVGGACPKCTNEELIAAIKYMMQESTDEKDFSLW